MSASVYDADLGTTTRPVLNKHPIKGLLTSFKLNETDGNAVQPQDRRLTLESSPLTFVPSMHDFVKIDEQDWEIMNLKREPSNSVYILQIRRP